MSAPVDEDPNGDLIVIGGGCYGSYHARQLRKALDRGTIAAREIVIVDRDPGCAARREFHGTSGFRFVISSWDDFHDAYFEGPSQRTRDRIAPTPIAPHLMCSWLMRRAASRRGPEAVQPEKPDGIPATPFSMLAENGTGYLSFATWTCPVTCIEPDICPKTRGPKDWDMDEAVFDWARQEAREGRPYDQVEVFRCRHYAYGVATFPVRLAVEARLRQDRLLQSGARPPRRCLVATVSSCHGVLNAFRVA